MAAKRASICTGDLRKIAKVAREEGVHFEGMFDPLGNFRFWCSPYSGKQSNDPGDDLDDRLAEFAAK